MTTCDDAKPLVHGDADRQAPDLVFTGERRGRDTQVTITQEGRAPRGLPLHLAIRNHSHTGFEWGYSGSGPAQLALAMCVEVVGQRRPEASYQSVKDRLVAPLQADDWVFSGTAVVAAVEDAERAARAARGNPLSRAPSSFGSWPR